jgi:hypothetical protein
LLTFPRVSIFTDFRASIEKWSFHVLYGPSHVARMQEIKNAYKILTGKLEGKYHLRDLRINGMIILKWT